MSKLILASAAAAAILGFAGPAFAVPPPGEQVQVTGSAEAICTLPASYIVASANGGAAAGQFSGSTWTIPEAAITNAASQSLGGVETAIRVAGTGFCNSSHIITITSLNGGMVTGGGGTPPAGFSNRRTMNYAAHWQTLTSPTGGPGTPFGPSASIVADVPNETDTKIYTVSGSLPPPGSRRFDVRMGVVPQAGVRMVAGNYTDTIVVSLTAQ